MFFNISHIYFNQTCDLKTRNVFWMRKVNIQVQSRAHLESISDKPTVRR